jgi:hypothetical protein
LLRSAIVALADLPGGTCVTFTLEQAVNWIAAHVADRK